MKILNSTKQDTNLSIQMTPISQVSETSELKDTSLIHVVEKVGTNQWESKRITAFQFKQKVYESVQNTFKRRYWDTHLVGDNDSILTHGTKSPFKEMINYLEEKVDVPTEVNESDPFVNHINYDFELIRRYFEHKNIDRKNEIDDINDRLDIVDYMFDQHMVITTDKKPKNRTNGNEDIISSNLSLNHDKNVDDEYCQMSITDGHKISNEWTTPADGMLVAYGWLDSSAALNNKGLPSCFCVLEAKVNSTTNLDSSGDWEILSVQNVFPAKNITYVSFTVPVHKGLKIRARTGFAVGVKSGQYSNEQDGAESLANSTPNGFKCQVFSNSTYSRIEV